MSDSRETVAFEECLQHGKKLEAFCEKDFKLLCIDCILSEHHKGHEIISVQKAADKQKAFVEDQIVQACKMEQKLIATKNDIDRHV